MHQIDAVHGRCSHGLAVYAACQTLHLLVARQRHQCLYLRDAEFAQCGIDAVDARCPELRAAWRIDLCGALVFELNDNLSLSVVVGRETGIYLYHFILVVAVLCHCWYGGKGCQRDSKNAM